MNGVSIIGARSARRAWTRVCRVEDIARPGARAVRHEGAPPVAIFRTESGHFYALVDRCPHRGAPLSKGAVSGGRVTCPLHNTRVELASGAAVAPDKGRVETFAVKVEKGVVYIELPNKLPETG